VAQVIWNELALRDVEAILHFVAQESPLFAERLADQFWEVDGRLGPHPLIGWRVPEFEEDTIRELLVHSYRVIYVVRAETCYVVAVIHGSRDLTRHIRPGNLPNLPR
jgi:plasmid stabilization system protein ParE